MVKLLAIVAVVAGLASTFAACTLLADDPPENTCASDLDCFTGVEQCNLDAGVCEPRPDGGTP